MGANMEDLFLLIIKESTGTKHNALRQTAQIAYGKYNIASTYTFYAFLSVCVGRVQQHRNNNSNEITKATCKKAISSHCCCAFLLLLLVVLVFVVVLLVLAVVFVVVVVSAL